MCDLRKAGAYKYSLDPTTKPTCLAFKILGEPTVYFLDYHVINRPWRQQSEKLRDLWTRLILEGYQFSAHNSFFERCIYDNILVRRYGWPAIPPRQRRCTAAKAAAASLPRKLEDLGAVLKLTTQKDKAGYVAMRATMAPTKKWKDWKRACEEVAAGKRVGPKKQLMAAANEPAVFLEPETAPQVFETLYRYCKIDVRTEELADLALPDLIPSEQEIWFQNQMLNWRGLPIDIPTVQKITDIMAIESKRKLKELDALTMGLVTKAGARKSIFEFLALEGIELPNLQKKTVEDALSGFTLPPDMQTLLEIRQALTMASTKKYNSFLQRANDDGRVRDILLYHGASTGRDTGTGVQPHNFPRGLLKSTKDRPYSAVENVIECDAEMLKILYGESLGVLFSALLRNMIIPTKGYEFFVADFSKVEVAVLWWLADNHRGLKLLRDGLDPYKDQAAANTGKSYIEIAEDGDDRQLGKAQILGGGFGMGALNFQDTAWRMYRLKLTFKQSREAIKKYRETHAEVPELWAAYEQAAIRVVRRGGEARAGKCRFVYDPKKYYGGVRFLWVYLPSGRPLAYADPQIAWRVRQFDTIVVQPDGTEVRVTKTSDPTETLEFWGVNPKTKKWAIERTWGGTLAENITQATARDLMMPGMVRLEKRGYRGLLMVHDEGITEKKIGEGTVDEFVDILCEIPPWATGMPISAKGWRGPRYRKG